MLLVRRNSQEVSLEKLFFYGGNDFWCAISRAGTRQVSGSQDNQAAAAS